MGNSYKVVLGAAAVFSTAALLGGCGAAPKGNPNAATAQSDEFKSPVAGFVDRLDQVTNGNPTDALTHDNGIGSVRPTGQGTYLVSAVFYSPVQKQDVVFTSTIDQPAFLKMQAAYEATKDRGLFDRDREFQIAGAQQVIGADAVTVKGSMVNVVALSLTNKPAENQGAANVTTPDGFQGFVFRIVGARTVIDDASSSNGSKVLTFTDINPITTEKQAQQVRQRLEGNVETPKAKAPAAPAQNNGAAVEPVGLSFGAHTQSFFVVAAQAQRARA